MKINQKQIDAVMALPQQKRYDTFIKVIADWEEVWGLYQGNWAVVKINDGSYTFPVWPAKDYAQLCADEVWVGYEPKLLSLDDFIEELLPSLKQSETSLNVFYTPFNNGMVVTVDQLLIDLDEELENY